jgi:hypothetical protein
MYVEISLALLQVKFYVLLQCLAIAECAVCRIGPSHFLCRLCMPMRLTAYNSTYFYHLSQFLFYVIVLYAVPMKTVFILLPPNSASVV